jgi:hypothetical protein
MYPDAYRDREGAVLGRDSATATDGAAMIASEIERALNAIVAMRFRGVREARVREAIEDFVFQSGWSRALVKASLAARQKQRENSPWRR